MADLSLHRNYTQIADSTTSGATAATITAVAGAASYAYKIAGASAGTVPSFGDTVTGYTAITAGTAKDIATTNSYYIIFVALDADGNVLAGVQKQAVIA